MSTMEKRERHFYRFACSHCGAKYKLPSFFVHAPKDQESKMRKNQNIDVGPRFHCRCETPNRKSRRAAEKNVEKKQ